MLAVLKWTRSEAEQAEGHLHSCYTELYKQCSCQEKVVCGGANHSEQIKQITFTRKNEGQLSSEDLCLGASLKAPVFPVFTG